MNSFGLRREEKSLKITFYLLLGCFFHIFIICNVLGFVNTLGNRNVVAPLEHYVSTLHLD